ncbi:hypothetical protein KM043_001031 [Ampulex compressa]|nr:hypothetical protein KM043_001031 [Ampulex compressa]
MALAWARNIIGGGTGQAWSERVAVVVALALRGEYARDGAAKCGLAIGPRRMHVNRSSAIDRLPPTSSLRQLLSSVRITGSAAASTAFQANFPPEPGAGPGARLGDRSSCSGSYCLLLMAFLFFYFDFWC